MDSLVLVGSGAALLYSLVNTYLAVVTEQHHDLYYEAAGTIIALVMLGQNIQLFDQLAVRSVLLNPGLWRPRL